MSLRQNGSRRVTAHLQLHAVKARPWHISDTTGDVCLSLLKEAQHEGAQLIVTGAYSAFLAG